MLITTDQYPPLRLRLTASLLLVSTLTLGGCGTARKELHTGSQATPAAADVPTAVHGANEESDAEIVTPRQEVVAAETSRTTAVADEESIYFDLGSSVLDTVALRALRKHAERLKADSKQSVTLVAHTDYLGSRSLNVAIAQQRLNVVVEALKSMGIPRRQLRLSSMGNEKAPRDCKTTCRRQMRRVDVVYER